jgi:DNA mismatch repair protein MSH5
LVIAHPPSLFKKPEFSHRPHTDRELEIVEDLSKKVLVHEEALTQICNLCAELDCLLSFAQAARTYDFNMPEMCEDNVIRIVKGRYGRGNIYEL